MQCFHATVLAARHTLGALDLFTRLERQPYRPGALDAGLTIRQGAAVRAAASVVSERAPESPMRQSTFRSPDICLGLAVINGHVTAACAALLGLACGACGDSGAETTTAADSGDGDLSGDDDAEGSNGAEPEASRSPYANVVAVEVTGTPMEYTFAVSVESADIDCSQYADWWEVLSEDGTLLYRRTLTHSHTDENGTSDADAPGNTFTRSGGPVPVDQEDVVLVRAHISPGGYEGKVMRGSPVSPFQTAKSLQMGFAADLEDAPPQPTGCTR